MNGEMDLAEDQVAEEERQRALLIYREFKNTISTAGWAVMLKLLEARPAALGAEAIEDDRPKEYWRGRLHEARWLLEQIALILEQGRELEVAAAEERKASAAAVRAFMGHGSRGGMA